jgi:STE24 endopeptidase
MIRFPRPLAFALLLVCVAEPLAAQPPGTYERAVAYSYWQYAMHSLEWLWTAGTLVAILNLRVAPRLRNWAERASVGRFLQAAIFVPCLMLVLNLPRLPLEMFRHWLDRRYDQSVQGWPSWLLDWTSRELLALVIATALAWILYTAIRRSPRHWWFHFWLASLPLLVFLFFIQPLAIDPLFFEFRPLVETQPALIDALLKVAGRGGLTIPSERIYEMKASEKLTSAGVSLSGVAASKRVDVRDITIAKMTAPQIQFLFGREMGHEALNHIPKAIALLAVLWLLALLGSYHGMNRALERWRSRWEIRGVEDWASLPLLMLSCTVAGFLAAPIVNTVSRHFERQADIYAIEVTFGLIPPAAQTGTEAYQIVAESRLEEPNPNPLIEFWLYDHPSLSERVTFAQQYDPWSKNETRFVR